MFLISSACRGSSGRRGGDNCGRAVPTRPPQRTCVSPVGHLLLGECRGSSPAVERCAGRPAGPGQTPTIPSSVHCLSLCVNRASEGVQRFSGQRGQLQEGR